MSSHSLDGDSSLSKEKQVKAKSGSGRCKVLLLDGTDYEIDMPKSAEGQELVDRVCSYLNLAEKDYFSCSYKDRHGNRFWIGVDQALSKSAKRAHPNWVFSFEVKFYPMDAAGLHEDYTRYLLFLQTRVDIVFGKLPCSFLAQALLGSYAVQSDIGDFNPSEHSQGNEYVRDIKFAPKQGDELLDKIAELHKTHRGDMPNEAEMMYLENAQMLALYGFHMYPARLSDGCNVSIGVGAIGLVVYKDQLRLSRFQWARILKLAYKRNKFTVRLRPSEIEEEPQIIVYKFSNNVFAKRFWRLAVEHHGFFRLKEPDPAQRAKFPHFGSKFRFSGRTQLQARGVSEGPERVVPKINRKASTRFIGAKETAYNTGTGGYSTDRAEQMIVEAPNVPTLDLKNRRNKTTGSGGAPVADGDDDRNLSVIDPGGNYGHHDNGGHVTMTSSSQVSYSRTTGGQYEYGSGQDTSIDEYSGAGSVDRRYVGGRDGDQFGAVSGSQWTGTFSSSSTTKTSTRTYTDADGTVVTEYITEKDGVVVDRRVEKRTKKVTTVDDDDDDVDYDKMLKDAIQQVTNMNPDMSVEKIEIHTKTDN